MAPWAVKVFWASVTGWVIFMTIMIVLNEWAPAIHDRLAKWVPRASVALILINISIVIMGAQSQ